MPSISTSPDISKSTAAIFPETVRFPPELKDIFSAAASEAATLKLNFVALAEALKSPSDIASIPAATNIASVPVPSSGAWKSIFPSTSLAAISVSPVCKVNETGLSSAVAVCLSINPLSALCISFTSWSLPKKITLESAR